MIRTDSQRRKRIHRPVIIGRENGLWYQYCGRRRIPIHVQQLARVAPLPRPIAPRTAGPATADTSGAILALGFLGVFSSLLAFMVVAWQLIKELLT